MLRITRTFLSKMITSVIQNLSDDTVEVSHSKKPRVVMQACKCQSCDQKITLDEFRKDMNKIVNIVATEDVSFHVIDAEIPFTISRHPECDDTSNEVKAIYELYERVGRKVKHVCYYWNLKDAENHKSRGKNYHFSKVNVVRINGIWRRYMATPIHIWGKEPEAEKK